MSRTSVKSWGSTEEDEVDRWVPPSTEDSRGGGVTPSGPSVPIPPGCINKGKVVYEGLKITDTSITSPYTRGFRQQLTHMENLRLFPPDYTHIENLKLYPPDYKSDVPVNWDEEFYHFVRMWASDMSSWSGGAVDVPEIMMASLEHCAVTGWSSGCRSSTILLLLNTLSTYMLHNLEPYMKRLTCRMSQTRRGLPASFPMGIGTGQWGAVNMCMSKGRSGWLWDTVLEIGGDDPLLLSKLGMRCQSKYSAGAFLPTFLSRWLNVHLPLLTLMQPMHATRIALVSSLGHLLIQATPEDVTSILEVMSKTVDDDNKVELVLFCRGLEYYLQTFFALLSVCEGEEEDTWRYKDYLSAALWIVSNIFSLSPSLPTGKDRDAVNRVCFRIVLKILCTSEAVSTVVQNRALGVLADAIKRVNFELPDTDSLALAISCSLNSQFLCIRAGAQEVLARAIERSRERGNIADLVSSFLRKSFEFVAVQVTAYAIKGAIAYVPDLHAAFKPIYRSFHDLREDYCVDELISEEGRKAIRDIVRGMWGIIECTMWEIIIGEGGGRASLQEILKLPPATR